MLNIRLDNNRAYSLIALFTSTLLFSSTCFIDYQERSVDKTSYNYGVFCVYGFCFLYFDALLCFKYTFKIVCLLCELTSLAIRSVPPKSGEHFLDEVSFA